MPGAARPYNSFPETREDGNMHLWISKEVEKFRSSVQSSTLFPIFLHLPYLPNIASFKSKFYKRSIQSIVTDLQRAEHLGAQYLIIHIGHRMESSEDEAIEAVSQGINQVFERARNSVVLLLEMTAGQGTEIGYTFEQIKGIIDGVHEQERVGVCFDTAHSFEAGNDLSQKDGIESTLKIVRSNDRPEKAPSSPP